MKTKEQLKNTYIEINGNEKLSRAVQERLFGMGFEWVFGKEYYYISSRFLFIDDNYIVIQGNFLLSTHTQIFPSDLGLTDEGEELFEPIGMAAMAEKFKSTIEKEPVYGDEVFVMNVDAEKWVKYVFAGIINDRYCVFSDNIEKKDFEKGGAFILKQYDSVCTTNPALDKTTLKITLPQALQQLAEFKKVDSVEIINE